MKLNLNEINLYEIKLKSNKTYMKLNLNEINIYEMNLY